MAPCECVVDFSLTDLSIIATVEQYWRESIQGAHSNKVLQRLWEYEKTGEMQAHLIKMRDITARVAAGAKNR